MSWAMRTLRTPSSAASTCSGLIPSAVIAATAAALREMSRRLISILLISALPALVFLAARRPRATADAPWDRATLHFSRAPKQASSAPGAARRAGAGSRRPNSTAGRASAAQVRASEPDPRQVAGVFALEDAPPLLEGGEGHSQAEPALVAGEP